MLYSLICGFSWSTEQTPNSTHSLEVSDRKCFANCSLWQWVGSAERQSWPKQVQLQWSGSPACNTWALRTRESYLNVFLIAHPHGFSILHCLNTAVSLEWASLWVCLPLVTLVVSFVNFNIFQSRHLCHSANQSPCFKHLQGVGHYKLVFLFCLELFLDVCLKNRDLPVPSQVLEIPVMCDMGLAWLTIRCQVWNIPQSRTAIMSSLAFISVYVFKPKRISRVLFCQHYIHE